jgi:hypothetical protein
LDRNQWLLGIGVAIALLLVDEVIKYFLRRSRQQGQQAVEVAQPAGAAVSGD